jgi:hypothetical protein
VHAYLSGNDIIINAKDAELLRVGDQRHGRLVAPKLKINGKKPKSDHKNLNKRKQKCIKY